MSLTEFPFGTAHQILNVQNAQIKMFEQTLKKNLAI